ncbi:hypothetical protein RRG08_023138 [Elysia crispata]|uniref:Uncharacterized protein n=1 Tax=Elysia crispata TaxID=231223 RepID=A0AAE1CJ40_9GAST|nr:hypothetical protein RRG08_023138 [Elysia crispata]
MWLKLQIDYFNDENMMNIRMMRRSRRIIVTITLCLRQTVLTASDDKLSRRRLKSLSDHLEQISFGDVSMTKANNSDEG